MKYLKKSCTNPSNFSPKVNDPIGELEAPLFTNTAVWELYVSSRRNWVSVKFPQQALTAGLSESLNWECSSSRFFVRYSSNVEERSDEPLISSSDANTQLVTPYNKIIKEFKDCLKAKTVYHITDPR